MELICDNRDCGAKSGNPAELGKRCECGKGQMVKMADYIMQKILDGLPSHADAFPASSPEQAARKCCRSALSGEPCNGCPDLPTDYDDGDGSHAGD